MTAIAILAAVLFVFGYVLITLEQKLGTHKSALALLLGAVLWVLAAVQLQGDPDVLEHLLEVTGGEIFGLIVFVLAAMALIEILVHYRFFDLIRARLIKLKVGDKQQFLMVMGLTFFLSAVLDNIAITIAMLQIARRFFTGKNLLIAAAGIVIAANAGGAWSPIGDVTTILLWLADKFTAAEVIMYTFLPALALCATATGLLYRKLDDEDFLKREQGDLLKLSLSERAIVGTALGSFSLPLAMSTVGLPPYFGLLFGLGLTWLMIEFAKQKSRREHQSHMTANIEKIIQTVDLASVKYLIGILLSVSALAALGVLAFISAVAVGEQPTDTRLIIVNIAIGLLSSLVDNTSLVAMAIDVLPESTSPLMWTLLALAAGTGGSIFVIASAAGVVAMGSMKQLTFQAYFKIATVPALAGFVVGISVWLIQYQFIT